MKKLTIILLCFFYVNLFSQISCIGFSSPICVQTTTNVYSFSNYSNGTGGSYTGGFNVYRNGTLVYNISGSLSSSAFASRIITVNDSTVFLVYRYAGSNYTELQKTNDYGATWHGIGYGDRTYLGLYVVNLNFAYLVTCPLQGNGNSVTVSKCSDVVVPQNLFIKDLSLNSDKYVMDTILNNSSCNIDSLNIFIKNNSDTITYHINKQLPLSVLDVKINNCVGTTVNIPYVAGATFNTGNIFIAQLSDDQGSFISPVNIGNISSINSGTISGVIPSSATSGNNYKVRVVSSNPFYISTDNGADISIYNSIPNIVFSGTTVCSGSSGATLTASGATSYTWNTGSHASYVTVYTPTTNITYTLSGANDCGISTETVNLTIDNTCQNVWPGDVDKDGYVDNLDILELGLHFNQSGFPRSIISNNWQPYYCYNWPLTLSNGKNLNHSDCNGDGIINYDDTIAINNNYYPSYQPINLVQNPQLTIIPDQDSVKKGEWGTASIYIGSQSNPINSLHGLAFSVSFTNYLIETDSIYIDYLYSFLDTANQNLTYKKQKFSWGKLTTASTHTNNIDVDGYGQIATIHYKIRSNLSYNYTLYLELHGAFKMSSSGNKTQLTCGSSSISAMGAIVGINEIFMANLYIYPNPVNSLLTINSNNIMQQIELADLTSRVLFVQSCSNKTQILNLENFSDGVYFITITFENGTKASKKVIVNH